MSHKNLNSPDSLLKCLKGDFKPKLYIPELKELTKGDIKAAILLSQIVYWWDTKGGKPFYKFNTPSSNHPLYKEGDSWTEDLGFSEYQFRSARSKIAAKVTTGSSKTELLRENYVVYWTESDRKTCYQVNEDLLRRDLKRLKSGRPLDDTRTETPNSENFDYISVEEDSQYIAGEETATTLTESTTEYHRVPS